MAKKPGYDNFIPLPGSINQDVEPDEMEVPELSEPEKPEDPSDDRLVEAVGQVEDAVRSTDQEGREDPEPDTKEGEDTPEVSGESLSPEDAEEMVARDTMGMSFEDDSEKLEVIARSLLVMVTQNQEIITALRNIEDGGSL